MLDLRRLLKKAIIANKQGLEHVGGKSAQRGGREALEGFSGGLPHFFGRIQANQSIHADFEA